MEMKTYLRAVPNQTNLEVWNFGESVAIRIDVANAENGPGCYFKSAPGESIWEAIKRDTPWFLPNDENPFHKTILESGQYFPRIARPNNFSGNSGVVSLPNVDQMSEIVAIARSQLLVLTRQLDRICQSIHPTPDNFESYGHEIRNLLILASTEVETHWRGILVSNGVQKKHYNTNQYIWLDKALKLDGYQVRFPSFPWLEPMQPFAHWDQSNSPTRGLGWYDSYNAVKHNRENEFPRATLIHLFEAVSACYVIMVAQFGESYITRRYPELSSFFQIASFPQWSTSEVYVQHYGGNHPFPLGTLPSGWTPVNYPFPLRAAS